jgi:ribosomal protein S18 acetylase RimI-like enzyme
LAGDLRLVKELFREYADSLEFDLGFQGFESELETLPGSYSAPDGCILLAEAEGAVAGCIALRPLGPLICEMKRLYIRPAFQGRGLGRELTRALLQQAGRLGYERIRLDTVPSMKAAISMYRSMGFYEIPPYRENPVPGASYLEKKLEG